MIGAAIGSSLVGGIMQKKASDKAVDAQTRAANNQIELDQRIYDETTANFAPYREGGLLGFNAMNYEMGLGEAPEGYTGFQASPGYQFAVDEGTRALEGSAAASGNLRSGATMKALQDRGVGMANQEYGNWMNRLSGIAGMGQAAAGNQAAAAQNFATNAGNAMSAIGNAQSAGAIATGNAWSNGINNVMGAYQMNQMMNPGGGGMSLNVPANSVAGNAMFGSGSWI